MLKQQPPVAEAAQTSPQARSQSRSWLLGLTSFGFILLQSACAAFMAISGLRLVIGVGALAAATAGFRVLLFLHGDVLRYSMEFIAIAGSMVNLLAIRRLRTLRARPSSAWRVQPATPGQLRSEATQIALAIVTLALVIAEWVFHLYLHDSI